jgi:hypothetical protein
MYGQLQVKIAGMQKPKGLTGRHESLLALNGPTGTTRRAKLYRNSENSTTAIYRGPLTRVLECEDLSSLSLRHLNLRSYACSFGCCLNSATATMAAASKEQAAIHLEGESASRYARSAVVCRGYAVTAVEKLKTARRASLAELDALFASLHHRAYWGEL